jgi:hypothetical protein
MVRIKGIWVWLSKEELLEWMEMVNWELDRKKGGGK